MADILSLNWVQTAIWIGVILIAALFVNFVVKRLLLKGLNWALSSTAFGRDQELRRHKVIPRIANIMPALAISTGAKWIPNLPEAAYHIVVNVTNAFIVLTIALAISGVLAIFDTIYHRRPESRMRPVKGFVQVAKIVIFAVAAILMTSIITDRSPTILLGGLGAMAAVLILVFQDTLLSFVAGIQILSNDLIRVGDWIEMPSENSDGDVIEVGLHMVKVQNWDNTISTIPVRKLASESFKNWRGMQESGGRRIKRCVYLDQTSVKFLTPDDLARLKTLHLLAPYLEEKTAEISKWNTLHGNDMGPGARKMTNIGTFRAYLQRYLQSRTDIAQHMTLMVRQKDPTAQGLPLEIYCFTNTTVWAEYEGIQADIFDHVLSIMPFFDIRVFQGVSGQDIRMSGIQSNVIS
jgi:miniconductance mechanosensitive channel